MKNILNHITTIVPIYGTIIILLIYSMKTEAQDLIIPLWNDSIPNYQDTGEEEILVTDTEIEHYALVNSPEIIVYLPAKKNSTRQSVLVIPGGGYQVVVHKWEGSDVAKWLNSKGIAAMVLKYRLPHTKNNIERDKSPLLDAKRAMRIIRANADKWNIDMNNIGVMGFSAGGHLASTLGTHFDKSENVDTGKTDSISARPDFMVLIYPVISMGADFTHAGSREFFLGDSPSEELMDYYSNEKHVSENTPPTFLIHTSDDDVVPVENSIAFYRALRNNNVNAEMHIFQHGEHGFSLANGLGRLESWKSLCLDWLRNYNKD